MAEVKNAFIKSKMNKDLDARLIPQGEYRDAVNIQVSKSEGDDVGALENVVGNVSVADLELGIPNLSCIGRKVDETNSIVYLFFTDNPDTSFNYTPTGVGSNHFIYRYNAIGNSLTKLVEGAFLNFSKAFPITGVNILENLLFFTDNRNQPRKINVNLANQFGQANYYTNEDQISVAKYFPYQPIEVIKETSTPGVYETTMKDVFSQYIPLDDPSYITNPYWADEDLAGNPNFPGDPQYLEDKFVRFSYRFKFDDGEYSLLAPFTQVCFIPKQDGYFLPGDEQQTVASTIVEFMENKVNEISLQIPLPAAADNISSDFKITELDIIYKESDGLALQVVETIPVSQITGTSNIFEYVYNSTKPYKTLPENEITRVYDKTPVKALGQEVTSNRVVYANFQDKHTPPAGIDYQVAATRKNENGDIGWAKTDIEYPNHTLKQNRNYQVGVVLSDKYGRQSTVVLSNNTSQTAGDYGADTVYLPYSTSASYDSNAFIGNSLKILFNDFIQSTKSSATGEPGLYNGDPTDPAYEPLGWYSYKIVIKQLEQEYYNVYAPGTMKGSPYYDTGGNPSIPLTEENASFITLLNDNINKVPRDLSEVGPQDKQFRSSVELFGIVENNFFISYNVRGNRQYFPGRKSFTTNTIEDLFDLYDTNQFDAGGPDIIPVTSTNSPYYAFYRSESNPFVAEFITSQTASNQFGVNNLEYTNTRVYEKFENLSVFETKPITSRLDIFWESTTSGLLEDLNTAIQEDTNGAFGIINFNYDHEEAYGLNVDITGDFSFTDVQGVVIVPNSTPVLTSVYDDLDPTDNRASEFTLVEVSSGVYKLQTNAYFYYGINAAQLESYTFTFTVETLNNNGQPVFSTPSITGSLTNNPPAINNSNSSPINVTRGQSSILTIQAVNGSNSGGGKETDDLTFAITSQSRNIFSISGLDVLNSDNTAVGLESFTLQVTDAGGATASKTFNINFGEPPANSVFSSFGTYTINDGDGAAFWFTGTSGFSSLTGNEVSILGSQPPFQGWLNGYQAPFTGPNNNPINNFICGGGTVAPEFYNERKTGALTQGTFFVILRPSNTKPISSSNLDSYVNLRYSIQQRSSVNIGWQPVDDLNGVSTVTNSNGVPSGTWEYNNAQTEKGLTATTNTNGSYGANGGLFVSNKQTTTLVVPDGALVLAFNTVGDYRIILGNLQSSYGTYDNNLDCNKTPDQSASADLVIGDFYNPPFDVANPIDFNTYGSTYRYEIVGPSAACSSTFNGVYKYAKEPFAKYVTRFYNDTDFLQPYTPITSASFKFRRMDRVDSADGNDIYNPEFTKEGAYTAYILSNGLLNSTPQPCLY